MALLPIARSAREVKIQQPEKEEDDIFDNILKGLTLANTALNIGVNVNKFRSFADEQKKLQLGNVGLQQAISSGERRESGFLTLPEALAAGNVPARPGLQGAIPLQIQGPGGVVESRDFIPASEISRQQEAARRLDINAVKDLSATAKRLKDNEEASKLLVEKAEREFKNEATLRKEHLGLPTTKNTQLLTEAVRKIRSVSKDSSPAGDLALIFNFMKMLDPGSTVREGEFANAQSSGSVPDRISATFNQLMSGERLVAKQRNDFLRQTENIFNSQLESQKIFDERFSSIAKINKLNPKNIIIPFGEQARKPIGVSLKPWQDALKKGVVDKAAPGLKGPSGQEKDTRTDDQVLDDFLKGL